MNISKVNNLKEVRYQLYLPILRTPHVFLELFFLWCPLVIAHICPVAKDFLPFFCPWQMRHYSPSFFASLHLMKSVVQNNQDIWKFAKIYIVSCFCIIIFKSVLRYFTIMQTIYLNGLQWLPNNGLTMLWFCIKLYDHWLCLNIYIHQKVQVLQLGERKTWGEVKRSRRCCQ